MLSEHPEDRLLAPLWNEDNVVLTVPIRVSKALVISHWVSYLLAEKEGFRLPHHTVKPQGAPRLSGITLFIKTGLFRLQLPLVTPCMNNFLQFYLTQPAILSMDSSKEVHTSNPSALALEISGI